MKIVGIYDYPASGFRGHDKAAAIISDNCIYAYEEAKLSSVKEDGYAATPEKSLFLGFKELNINPAEVDLWVFTDPPEWINSKPVLRNYFEQVVGLSMTEKEFDIFFVEKVSTFKHHDAHMALGAYTSNIRNGLVVSMDGGGDYGDSRHFVCKEIIDGRLSDELVVDGKGSNGLANFHGWLTEAVGFTEDGKCSGIAAYGQVNNFLYEQFKQLIKWDSAGYYVFVKKRYPVRFYDVNKINVDRHERRKYLVHQPGLTNLFEVAKSHKPQDIAATGTKLIIDCILETLKLLQIKTKKEKIALVGGLFNNVAINRAIVESNIFEEVHFTMAPGDCGLALGLALQGKNKIRDNADIIQSSQPIFSPYIGPSFGKTEVNELLQQMNIQFTHHSKDELPEIIAKLIEEGFTVGTFYGRAEYGPRSLGHRSILGDARRMETKQKINLRLKKRDWFMPYAPAILQEYVYEWASTPTSPYMQLAANVSEQKKILIPSAVHIDGSARFQAVSKSLSPFFYRVIQAFNDLTGIPVVLNTSFNRHGIATIGTPRAALHHLLEGTVDYLILGCNLISFRENRSIVDLDTFQAQDESSLLREFEAMHSKKIAKLDELLDRGK